MYGLTQEEVDLLIKSQIPEIAAVALKLKKSVDDGEFIPKSRLSQEIQAKKDAEAKIKVLETEKTTLTADFTSQIEAITGQKTTLEATLADKEKELVAVKPKADRYDKWEADVRAEVKKKIPPEKWNPSYDATDIGVLVDLVGLEKIGVFHEKKQIQPDDIYTMDEMKKMSQQEVNANLEKVNRSLSKQKQ
jgi:hypothetical protein